MPESDARNVDGGTWYHKSDYALTRNYESYFNDALIVKGNLVTRHCL